MTKSVPLLSGRNASVREILTAGGVWQYTRQRIIDLNVWGSASTAFRKVKKPLTQLSVTEVMRIAEILQLPLEAMQADYLYVLLPDGRVAAAEVKFISEQPLKKDEDD